MHLNNSTETPTDQELIHAFQTKGDQQALVVLLKRYGGYVIAFAGQHLKDKDAIRDFSQELFLKLRDKLKGTEVRNFKSWLYTVMRNMFLDEVRKTSLHQKVTALLVPDEPGYKIDRQIEMEFLMPKLEAALEKLSPEEAQCVRAVYLEEKSYQEIIAETGWSFNQVRGYRQRGIQKLRKDLKYLWTGT